MMADIISVLVVLVFVLIVFRKRLAPLFRGRTKPEEARDVETVSVGAKTLKRSEGCVYVHVYAVDTSNYITMRDMSNEVETNLYDRLAKIYNEYAGSFDGIDCIRADQGILVFLIRWHT